MGRAKEPSMAGELALGFEQWSYMAKRDSGELDKNMKHCVEWPNQLDQSSLSYAVRTQPIQVANLVNADGGRSYRQPLGPVLLVGA